MLSKEKLENTIDTLPAETRNYVMILADLNRRLYKQYDFIAEIQDKIEDAEIKRKHGIEMINVRSKDGAKVHHPTKEMA